MRSFAPALPKWSPAAAPSAALGFDQRAERSAGPIDDVLIEGTFEHHDARAVGQRADQLGLQPAAVGAGDGGGRVHRDVVPDIGGQG